ncbi:MAG: response regulator transcription factor [Verrucomicrobiota bacterium]|nr:response regulator transcription factor [Verrucomicrobiota bacterium]
MQVGIIEDQQLFREMLCDLVAKHFRWQVAFEVADGLAGLKECRAKPVDILLLDIMIPQIDGLSLATTLIKETPQIRILALSAQCDDYTLHRVVEIGFLGFVDKNRDKSAVLKEAILRVAEGHTYFAEVVRRVQNRLISDPKSFTKILTDREQELLIFLGAGLSNEEISPRVNLKPSAIQSHRRNILKKLDLHSTPELMRYSLSKGFIRSPTTQPGD